MKQSKWLAAALCGFMAAGLGACSTTSNPNETTSPSSENSNTADTGKIIIEHALGTTVLDELPERIVTIGWENQDTPLALGIVPVGISAAAYGETGEHSLHPWTEEALEELGDDGVVIFNDTDGWDYEAIADAQPDVILAAYSGMTQEEYNRLSKIAPVIAYPEAPWLTLWREQTLLNAAGLGKEEEGIELVKDTEQLIAEKTALYPNLKGVKTAFFWVSPDDLSSFYVYTPKDPRAAYLTDLGLVFPDSVAALAGENDFSVTISRENADQLSDVDMIVVYGNEDLLKAMQADPLLSQIPAIKNGAVALIDENSALAGGATPSILSIPYNIDDYLELLSTAAANVK